MLRASQKVVLLSLALAGCWHVIASAVRFLSRQPYTWVDVVGAIIFFIGVLIGTIDLFLQSYSIPLMRFFGFKFQPIEATLTDNGAVPVQPSEVLADNAPVSAQTIEQPPTDSVPTLPIQPVESIPENFDSRSWELIPDISNNRAIVKLLNDGYSDHEIANQLNMHRQRISNIITELRKNYGTELVPTRKMLKEWGIKCPEIPKKHRKHL